MHPKKDARIANVREKEADATMKVAAPIAIVADHEAEIGMRLAQVVREIVAATTTVNGN